MNQQDYKTWDASTKNKYLHIAKDHQDMDRFMQWKWLQSEMVGEMHKWCFYGCMTQYEDNTLEKAVEVMKLPTWIIYVSERIFEWLPSEESVLFPLQLLEVIPTNTNTWDIYRARHRSILCDPEHGIINYTQDKDVKNIIQEVHDLRLNEVIDVERADSAKSAAKSVAYSAAYSAAEAAYSVAYSAAESAALSAAEAAESAYSAAYSAESAALSAAEAAESAETTETAHYQWMRDTLLSLLKGE